MQVPHKTTKLRNKKNRPISAALKPSLIALSVMHGINSHAATIHVGGTLGQGCGLSAAILSANQNRTEPGSQCVAGDGDDTIELHRDITIRNSWKDDDNGIKVETFAGMPLITSNITINGNGHSIRRDVNAPEFRLLRSSDDANLSINNLGLYNGKIHPDSGRQRYGRHGGAILTLGGSLNIHNSRIKNNQRAIYSISNVQVTDSDFSYNTNPTHLAQSFLGSTITGNSLYLKNSFFEKNQGTVIFSFQGIQSPYSEGGDVKVIDSHIRNNDGKGIFISRSPSMEIKNTVISGNAGRGVETFGSIGSIQNSIISNNIDTGCAGINIIADSTTFYGPFQSSITISNSSISNNTATESNGGGVCSIGTSSYYYLVAANTVIENSTLNGNYAHGHGGGIFTASLFGRYGSPTNPITVINTTVSSNSAGNSGGGIYLDGDALNGDNIYYDAIRDSRLTLLNSTIVGNSAVTDGGGIDANAAYLNIANSIIVGNSSSGTANEISAHTPSGFTGAPAIERSQNNVFGTSSQINFQALGGFTPSNTDITATIDGTIPTRLESIINLLQDNGGPTLTHSLPAGSPALDTADTTVCNDAPVNGVDQRGMPRSGNACDVGAYESISTDTQVGFMAQASNVTEGNNKFVIFTITLDSQQITDTIIDFATVDGTAIGNVDYVSRVGKIFFAPGETVKRRWVEVLQDDEVEGDETFSLKLNSTNDPNNEVIVEATITDDDFDDPNNSDLPFTASASNVVEGNNKFVIFTVTLDSPQTTNTIIDFITIDGTAIGGVDYVSRAGKVFFAPGETVKRRWVEVLQDNALEGDETFSLQLSPTNDPSNQVTVEATITDDD